MPSRSMLRQSSVVFCTIIFLVFYQIYYFQHSGLKNKVVTVDHGTEKSISSKNQRIKNITDNKRHVQEQVTNNTLSKVDTLSSIESLPETNEPTVGVPNNDSNNATGSEQTVTTVEIIDSQANNSIISSNFTDIAPTISNAANSSNADAININPASNSTTNSTIIITDNATQQQLLPINASCFPHNSHEWLHAPKFYGYGGPNLTIDHVQHMILGNVTTSWKYILSQTLAYNESKLLHDDLAIGDETSTSIQAWGARILLLAIHYHQHRPAYDEAKRYVETLQQQTETAQECVHQRQQVLNLSHFDYECRDAKFIVTGNTNNGIGANVAFALLPTLLAGIVANRTVLFTNHYNGDGSNYWHSASCPRRDFQCFFAPSSPCMPTDSDLMDSPYVMTHHEKKDFLRFGRVPEHRSNDRVLITSITQKNSDINILNPSLELVLRDLMTKIIDDMLQVPQSLPGFTTIDAAREYLQRAVDALFVLDERPDGSKYLRSNRVHRIAIIYLLRPNIHNKHAIDMITNDNLASDFNPELSIGIPLRASDKCWKESDCLSFDRHLDLVAELYNEYYQHANIEATGKLYNFTPPQRFNDVSVVFTTEAPDVYQQQQNYAAELGNKTFSFVVNTHDVKPGTGRAKGSATFTADEIMLSAFSSLRLQIAARYSVGNCCSNFHHVLYDFVRENTGMASENYFQCLQEAKNPHYHICCWKNPTCTAQIARAIVEYDEGRSRIANMTNTTNTTISRRR